MHNRMQEGQSDFTQGGQKKEHTTKSSSPDPEPKTKAGDYIDFEEVK